MIGIIEQKCGGLSVKQAVAVVDQDLQQTGVESPRVAAEWVVADLLGVPRLELMLRGTESLTEFQTVRLDEIRHRLRAHEPIQYVLGETEFMGLVIQCDDRALIPRPETECLVDLALQDPVWERSAAVQVIDVGTGSGCIALAIANEKPLAHVVAVDASAAALELARENATRLGLTDRICFVQGDLLRQQDSNSADIVLANLPYISRADCAVLPPEIRLHEPLSALDGGEDGLELVLRLIEQARQVLVPGGKLLLEIGADQGPQASNSLIEQGYLDVEVLRDGAGRDRIVRGVST